MVRHQEKIDFRKWFNALGRWALAGWLLYEMFFKLPYLKP